MINKSTVSRCVKRIFGSSFVSSSHDLFHLPLFVQYVKREFILSGEEKEGGKNLEHVITGIDVEKVTY